MMSASFCSQMLCRLSYRPSEESIAPYARSKQKGKVERGTSSTKLFLATDW